MYGEQEGGGLISVLSNEEGRGSHRRGTLDRTTNHIEESQGNGRARRRTSDILLIFFFLLPIRPLRWNCLAMLMIRLRQISFSKDGVPAASSLKYRSSALERTVHPSYGLFARCAAHPVTRASRLGFFGGSFSMIDTLTELCPLSAKGVPNWKGEKRSLNTRHVNVRA